MSNIYISEPPTNGKVLLKTTAGDIDIELWSKEAPKACRNFVQLCLEGYYNGTIFHRVIQRFIIQGGDPTGTGEGGESIYGKPFKDEFHQRLKFNRRGLIAMANAGPNDNGSQFFFTLDRADHLNRKHTLFAKVTGPTVYNMLKLAEVETDHENRPLEPHKIKTTEVLSNPFDDIIPRRLKSKEDSEKKEKKGSKSKATKNFSLLSFGEEAEEDEEESVEVSKDLKSKSKSAHDLIDDPRLSNVPAVQSSEASNSENRSKRLKDDVSDEESDVSDEEYNEQMKEQIRKKLKKSEPEKAVEKKTEVSDEQTLSRSEQLRKESRQLKKEMLEAKKKKLQQEIEEVKEDNEDDGKDDDNTAVLEFRQEKKKYKEKRKKLGKGSSREEETLAMLAKFQSRLQSVRTSVEEREEKEFEENKEEEKEEEELEEDLDIPVGSLLSHRLHFENRHNKVKDANVQDEDTFAIYDPRNPINKRRREESKQKGKRQSNR